jgi:uncharacterized protein DUF6600
MEHFPARNAASALRQPKEYMKMTFKHMLLNTAAAGSLLLAIAAIEPAVFSLATKAEAATNISISIDIGTFYDDLAPYGNWVSYHDRYVWIPEDVDDRWRPYTEGHWVYTRRYGWMWVSDERFGWATYHYGRWGFGRDIGWYWVPGRRWAPAWVAFSYDDDDFAWAPLPPDHYDDVNIVVSFGDIPDYYWQAAPFSAFLSIDLSDHVYRDRDRVRTVIQGGEPQTVSIENNIVVNNVITVDDIEKKTKKKVVVLEEKAVDNPDAAGKADSNSVAIFNPEVKEETAAKPKKTRKIEEVVKEREAKGIPKEEQPSSEAATTTDEPVIKPKKDKAIGAVAPQDEQQDADQPATKKKKKKAAVSTDQQNVDETVNVPAEEQAAPADKKKKKKDAAAPEQQAVEKSVEAPAEEQTAPADKKKKKADQKGQPECDPAVSDCPPAE